MAGIHGNYELVTDGLVLCLDATNPRSYPASGNVIYDIGGEGNNAFITGNYYYSSTNNGSIILGPSNSVIMTVNPSLDLSSWFRTNNFSIVSVVRADNLVYPQSSHPITVNHTVYDYRFPAWSAGHRVSKDFIEIRVADGVNYNTTNINYPTANYISSGVMYHRVFTIDRTFGCLTKHYINGVYIGEANAPNVSGPIFDTAAAAALDAGHPRGLSFGNVWGWRFIGAVSQFMVFNRVLTQEEITKNFNATKRRLRF